MEKLTKTPGKLELAQAVNTLADEIYQDTGMHTTESINTETGVHGLRYYDGVLAYKDGDIWVPISAGGGAVLPPNPVTNLSLTPGDGYVKIMWADPSDNARVGTKVVRKEGGYPKSPTDGIVVIDSQNRNAYAVNPLIDAELTIGTTYYYHIFSYTSGRVCNTDVSGRGECSPVAYATYGVRIDTDNFNSETSVTYTDDAVGMVAGSIDWDTCPIFKDIKPCLLKDGVVEYYLNPYDFTKKEDGTVATINNEDEGDVMIEFPKIGFKITTTVTTLM